MYNESDKAACRKCSSLPLEVHPHILCTYGKCLTELFAAIIVEPYLWSSKAGRWFITSLSLVSKSLASLVRFHDVCTCISVQSVLIDDSQNMLLCSAMALLQKPKTVPSQVQISAAISNARSLRKFVIHSEYFSSSAADKIYFTGMLATCREMNTWLFPRSQHFQERRFVLGHICVKITPSLVKYVSQCGTK